MVYLPRPFFQLSRFGSKKCLSLSPPNTDSGRINIATNNARILQTLGSLLQFLNRANCILIVPTANFKYTLVTFTNQTAPLHNTLNCIY